MVEKIGADEFVVEGYVACRCGQFIADPGERTAVVLCPDCRAGLRQRSEEGRFRYEAHGRTFTTKPRAPRPRSKSRTPRPRLTVEQRDRRKKLDRARMRAYVRLARVYRPMFEIMLAEEKLKEGLDPTIRSAIPRPRAIEAEILRDLAEAEERETRARLDTGS